MEEGVRNIPGDERDCRRRRSLSDEAYVSPEKRSKRRLNHASPEKHTPFSEDARLECKEALANFKDQKTKRNELLQEIGMSPTSMHESALSKTIGTLGSGNGSGEPIPRGPMDKFTTSQPRQSTLNSKWKQEEREEMLLQNFGPWFKPPSMHELRTWILKEEVNDLSIIMEDHKKLGNNMDVQLCQMVGQMEKVVEEIGEENVVQVITDNASNYVNAGMRLMEKRSRLWWTPCAAHCIDLMLEDIGKLNVHATTLSRARQISGYYLNPQLRYGDKFSNVDEVRKGLFECMDRMLDYQERLKLTFSWTHMTKQWVNLGVVLPIDSRTLRSPTSWWMRFGGSTPELQKFAIRVLSLTCSDSGCERNWSTFESIHTKKRNRLEHQRLNALVYVRYNTRLRERSLQRKQNVDPILVEEIDSDDEWIVEKEDPLLPLDLCWLQIMNYSMLMSLELCHPTPKRRKHHRIIWFLHIPTKGNIIKYQVSTSGGKGKEKELNLTPIDEDEDLDEMGIHDSGHFPTIDTLDEDDDDLGEEDLS
ncbi:hypothetical protein CK203_021220 [Vitis vinifera]|uniref:DUF659 domain-containing protein n=1 Tax=Vitis vinifera TaxID=29760 RepID=A0A438IMJ4_VITVI|nr:hypothetical protein CK203_021220 [Vitis vinifera]